MAILQRSDDQTRVSLEAEHMVGRSPVCALTLSQEYVSSQHAVLRWTGDHWVIRDLGSSNGTTVDGVQLRAGQDHPLEHGARLAFGHADELWELTDCNPPQVMVVPTDGSETHDLTPGLLALPSSESPEVTIYSDLHGQWLLETADGATHPLRNQEAFTVCGQSYRFSCPHAVCATRRAETKVHDVALEFSVSRDEEHIELSARVDGELVELGSRNHNYLLLTLARARIAEQTDEITETSAGWLYQEDLLKGLAITQQQLNIDIFRIRRHFSKMGIPVSASVVERRSATKQLRIGVSQLSVTVM